MNALYRVIGISKQSFHQQHRRNIRLQKESGQLLPEIRKIREEHPRMSSRRMYKMIAPAHLGRDRFEEYCFKNGFKVKVKRSFHRTTNSVGVTKFDNLLSTRQVTGVNQVWVSDITYYRIGEKFYYLTFIMDLYSRFIVGYSASRTLLTEETTIPALKMALAARDRTSGIIIHSDGGGQYYSKEWLALTKPGELRNSMCESVYENAHAERLNGIIKNDYLLPYGPESFNELIDFSRKAIMNYNYKRPHQSIRKLSPAQFEHSLKVLNVDNSRELPTSNTYDYNDK
jgi:putative transposase